MRKLLSFLLVLALVLTPLTVNAAPASSRITTTPTGYDSADDVQYVTKTVSGRTVIANWGARGEDCVFLSSKAVSYYTGNYTYDALTANSGGTSTSNVPSSALYKALQSMMKARHSYEINYQATRDYYRYTDCVSNDYTNLSLFYSGKIVNGTWDAGKTYNREHTWPNSKGMNGRDEDDIMMLRPADPSGNSSRGNKAYGESSGYYNPGVSVRGDCARIALYIYTRWGNTNLFGSSGVIENLDILLKWMEEDPVDTWEMGRNDSVQSITGVRNVFIDYPEMAWLMFGREIPNDITTPSGEAKENTPTPCQHPNIEVRGQKDATCTVPGYTGDTYCKSCGVKVSTGSNIPAGHKDSNNDGFCDRCGYTEQCGHRREEERGKVTATCTQDGYTGDTYCQDCGEKLGDGRVITAPGHTDNDNNNVCDVCTAPLSSTEPTEPTEPTTEPSTEPSADPSEGSSETATKAPTTAPADNLDNDTGDEKKTDSDNDNMMILLAIGGGSLAAIAVVVLLIIKSKKPGM